MIKKWLLLLPLMATAMLFAITPKIQANTNTYNLNLSNNHRWSRDNGTLTTPSTNHTATPNKIQIINNSLIFNDYMLVDQITWYNNSSYLGFSINQVYNGTSYYDNNSGNRIDFFNNNNIVIPVNATHFALHTWWGGLTANSHNEMLQLIATYEAPATTPVGYTALDYTIIEGGPYQWTNLDPIPHPQGPFGQYTSLIPVTSNTIDVNDPSYISHITVYDTDGNYRGNLYNPSRFTDSADRQFMNLGLIEGARITLPSTNSWTTGYIRLNNFSDSGIPSIITNKTLAEFQSLEVLQYDEGFYYVYYANHDGTVQIEYGPYSSGDTFDETADAINQLGSALNREGFTFLGSFDGPNQITNSNIIKYAQYGALEQYTIRFYDYDFTTEQHYLYHTMTVYEGQTEYDLPDNPTQYGYTFTHWQPPVVNITGDLDTYAQYDTNNFLVTWVDRYTDEVYYSESLPYGSPVPFKPDPTREGYTFEGWVDVTTLTVIDPTSLTVNGPLEINGILSENVVNEYTIIFKDLSGNTLSIQSVPEGQMPIIPERTGFERIWDSNVTISTGPKTYNLVSETPDPTNVDSGITVSGTTIIYRTQLPDDYNGLTDLFGGVFGGIIGLVMTLGTIDLFGIQLSAIIYLFISASLGLTIFKMIRG